MKLTIQDALEKEKSQYPHALLRSVPPGYAFSAAARRLLGSLSSALGRRLNICLRLQASAPVPTFNVPFSLCRCSLVFCPPRPLINEPV